MAIEPVASGCGSVMPLLAPAACWTRKYWPGARVVGGSSVTDHVDEVAPAYCTDQPVRSAGVVPRLNSSMKSLRYGAFELPPPPNSWEITICAVGVAIGVGLGDGEAVGEGIGVAVGEGDAIGVAVGIGVGVGGGVGVGDGVGVGVGVGVGEGVGRGMKRVPSRRVPGLKGSVEAERCGEKGPVMSGARVIDWF